MKYLLLTLVLPAWLYAQTHQPHPLIESVLVNGQHYNVKDNAIKIKSADNLIIILSGDLDTNYIYQLQGRDTNFIQSNKPIAIYPNLEKGEYQFHVKPISFTQDIPPLVIQVKNSFMDSWWFVPLLMFYLLLLFGGARYFIMLSNFRNKEKVHELRSDWTNKLHNDIGGDLSSVSVRLEILKKRLSDLEPKMSDNLIRTYDILKSIQKKLRFVFDLVDPSKDSLHVMFGEIQDFALENYTLKQIQLDYQNQLQPSDAFKIDIGRVNRLYLVLKEAVNNTMKYSEATNATIHINRTKEGLCITLSDNGKGFNTTVTHKGNGIKNLRNYAREGLMDIDIQSAPEKGTTITILVPEL